MTVRGLFVSGDGRLRAGWRIAIFLALFIVISVLVMSVFSTPLDALDGWFGLEDSGSEVGLTVAALLTHLVLLRFTDRRTWSYVRLSADSARRKTFGFGFLVGALPIAVASLALIAIGWLSFQPSPGGSWMMAAVKVTILLAIAAFFEEILSRGYIFSALSDGLTTPGAVAITSVAFGVLHMGNPGVTPLSILSVILAGIFLAAVLLVTKSLYAAWAAHFAWNWIMAVPLHVAVSGTEIPRPGYQLTDTGPDWASGGEWGPEGGVFAAVAMVAVMWWMYRRKKSAVTQNA